MPKPTADLLKILGPPAEPFERFNKNNSSFPLKEILKGETDSFDHDIYNATDDELPPDARVSDGNKLAAGTRYLWIINADGLFVLWEQTPNPNAFRKVVCHTNITKGAAALQGGELWYTGGKNVIINFKSGRYGAETTIQENAVVAYFNFVGYEVAVAG